MALNITGETSAARTSVTPLVAADPLIVVEEAVLGDKDLTINNTQYSGKDEGSMLIVKMTADDKLQLVIATGPAPTDTWVNTVGVVVTTPA